MLCSDKHNIRILLLFEYIAAKLCTLDAACLSTSGSQSMCTIIRARRCSYVTSMHACIQVGLVGWFAMQ